MVRQEGSLLRCVEGVPLGVPRSVPQCLPQCLSSAGAVFAQCLCNACSDARRGLLRLMEPFHFRVENTHFAEKGGIRGGGHKAWVEDAHGRKTYRCPGSVTPHVADDSKVGT